MKFIAAPLLVSYLVSSSSAKAFSELDSIVQLEGEEAPPAEAPADPAPAPPEESPSGDAVVDQPKVKVPFTNPVIEGVGCVLMWLLIALSNAGGLSGAGSNIPIMLIFFGLEMKEAVPISAFVAVVATIFRFVLNFNQKHPNRPERNCINYEIVQLTMPCVFLGSFLGVMLGAAIGQLAQICIFGITVAWSI
jgi:uncharacterized membrane protein YfcA